MSARNEGVDYSVEVARALAVMQRGPRNLPLEPSGMSLIDSVADRTRHAVRRSNYCRRIGLDAREHVCDRCDRVFSSRRYIARTCPDCLEAKKQRER